MLNFFNFAVHVKDLNLMKKKKKTCANNFKNSAA